MSPFDELSNNDNTSAADDIVSESSGFKTSPADDLFDIIEPSEPAEDKNEELGFVQDEDFLNSLDFINGFSDIDENESEDVEDNEINVKAEEDLDLNEILNEAAPDTTEEMNTDTSDNAEGIIADIPGITEEIMTDAQNISENQVAAIPDVADGMISDIPDVPNEAITEVPIDATAIEDPAEEMITNYMAAADIPSESDMTGIQDAAIVADSTQGYDAIQPEVVTMPEDIQAAEMQPVTDYQGQESMTDSYNVQQENESIGDASYDGEIGEEYEDDYYDDSEDESLMIVTEGTTITGSIGTNTSMLILGSVNGDITCEGKLTISGKVIGNSFAMDIFVNSPRVEGNIGCTGTLKISQGTVVIGDISAGAAAIAGAVKGNLDITGPVILDSTAVIKGNIKAKSVQLINGAVLEGFCTLDYSDSQLDEIFANDAG